MNANCGACGAFVNRDGPFVDTRHDFVVDAVQLSTPQPHQFHHSGSWICNRKSMCRLWPSPGVPDDCAFVFDVLVSVLFPDTTVDMRFV